MGQNVPPESNHRQTLAKSKLKDILQNNRPGLYRSIKVVTKQTQAEKLFWIEADDGNTEANTMCNPKTDAGPRKRHP